MKTAANPKWDCLAGAALASRDAWRRIISMISEALTKGDDVRVLHEIREIALGENGRLSHALKKPERR